MRRCVSPPVYPSVRPRSWTRSIWRPTILRLTHWKCVYSACVVFSLFFFLVLAVPNFFYSDFSYSSNLIFLRAFFFPALLVVLVGLCRWLRIIFGLVHDVMAKGRWVQERSECTYAWYVFWRLPPVKTMDPIAIEIGAKIRLAKISDLINDVNSTHLGKSIWIIQIRFVI